MESCRLDWRATNGQAATEDVPDEPEVLSGNVRDMTDLALFLKIDAG